MILRTRRGRLLTDCRYAGEQRIAPAEAGLRQLPDCCAIEITAKGRAEAGRPVVEEWPVDAPFRDDEVTA